MVFFVFLLLLIHAAGVVTLLNPLHSDLNAYFCCYFCLLYVDVCCCLSWPGRPYERGIDSNGFLSRLMTLKNIKMIIRNSNDTKQMTGRRSEVLSLQTQSNCHSWESLPPLRRQNQKTCQEPDWVVAASGTAVSAGSSPLCLPACMHACCKHVHSHYFCNPSEYLKRRPHAHGGKLR